MFTASSEMTQVENATFLWASRCLRVCVSVRLVMDMCTRVHSAGGAYMCMCVCVFVCVYCPLTIHLYTYLAHGAKASAATKASSS